MHFGAPYFAVLFWLIPAAVFFGVLASRMRKKALKRFAKEDLADELSGSVDAAKRKLKWNILVTVIFLSVVTLMRPQWGFQWQEVKRQGLDIMIALDTSKSMLAEDVMPNRLERSKLAIKDLVKKLRGDRVGLIIFSGTAFLQCPLTLDYEGFLLSLDDVGTDSVPVGGTSLSEAVYTSIRSFDGGKKKHKILIIIADGEDLEGGVEQAVQRAKADNITIYCVGIGSEEGELVPIRDEHGKINFLKDAEGNVVKTRINEEMLQRMALETKGIYVRSSGVEFGLDLIYREKLSKLEKEEFKSRMEKKYFERFQFALFPAIFLLLVEPLIGDRKRKKYMVNNKRNGKKK